MLLPPVVLLLSALAPLTVLLLPVVLLLSAFRPLAVLLPPVVLEFKAPEPTAVLDDIAPAPLPTRTPDRVASVVEEIAPTTSNLTAGLLVPIPKPVEVRRIPSSLPLVNAMLSDPPSPPRGKKMPVFVSPA